MRRHLWNYLFLHGGHSDIPGGDNAALLHVQLEALDTCPVGKAAGAATHVENIQPHTRPHAIFLH
jgi:hypothetical protein